MAPGAWGCSSLFLDIPPPLDGADDRLAALVHVDMLDRDLLLAFAAGPVQRLEQHRPRYAGRKPAPDAAKTSTQQSRAD